MRAKSRHAWALLALSAGLVAAFFVLREHWAHALGLLPYALLIVCPLLHLFHGHGNHSHHKGTEIRGPKT